MNHPLDSCCAKIQRANENIQNLDAEIARFLEEVQPTVTQRYDETRGEHIVSATGKTPPDRFGVLAGEIVHHLRSALDHIAHQLVLANGHHPSTHTEFPVFVTRDQYKARGPRKVQHIADTAVVVIESLQPYHRGHPNARNHPLWVVHEMDIADKHRLLVVLAVRAYISGAFYWIDQTFAESGDSMHFTSAVLRSQAEAELGRLKIGSATNVPTNLARRVVFDKIGTVEYETVIPTLQHLSDFTSQTADLSKPFFV